MSEELKPCPYCGGKGKLKNVINGFYIPCPQCMKDLNRGYCNDPTPESELKPVVCYHGSLKRQCEICERDYEIDSLNAEYEVLRGKYEADRIAYQKRIKELEALLREARDEMMNNYMSNHLAMCKRIHVELGDKMRENYKLRDDGDIK